ncbi:acyltransferase family protein [Oharaeibacter diazotrophicus]|uniref:Putative membrane protein YcfT n=1 Tax=Oharaeibacter diazotrophicus TaxID=1920512 RepID=A0A4R6R7J3_9HYPH|nr:acyltransferase family protein [Oharaeibacter diazotrophicus]TDP81950.1 putative membrane protein YcfT [Oharaeibacter diazotrophicus]BBE73582.1 inner membrane protein YcfT [Pleomorphomonas sp. SM30]GLS75372.1 acyltransferase [Oharaeibacter diazotrophicus]
MSHASERVDWIDTAKAICIVFVVMMHSTLGVEKAAGATGFMTHVVEFAKPFRMPDFFLVAGLFLGKAIRRDWRTFLDRRVVHFFYFYVVWLVVQFAFKAPGMVADDGVAETLRLFATSLFLEPFGTLWFIWILPFFALAVRLTRTVPVWAMLALAAAAEIAPVETGWVAIDETAARFVYFYAGYAFAPTIFRLAAGAAVRPALGLGYLAAWAAVNGTAVHFGWASLPGVSLVLGALGAMAIVTVSSLIASLPTIVPPFRFVGENSLVVYLGFFLPMVVTREALLRTGVIADIGWISLITTVTAVVVPFLMWRAALAVGATFLYERPAFARVDRPRRVAAVAPAE